jgi:hypothetical protein
MGKHGKIPILEPSNDWKSEVLPWFLVLGKVKSYHDESLGFWGLQHLGCPQIHRMPQSGNVYGDTVLTKPTLGDRRSVKKKRNENRSHSRSHMFSMSCAEYLSVVGNRSETIGTRKTWMILDGLIF